MVNLCGVLGLVLSLAGTVIIIITATLRQFVYVYLIDDVDQIGDDRLIASLGVFTTEYDPSPVDESIIASAGLPTEGFVEPTTEFSLLFPAQQNFVVEILPIDAELADGLDAALEAGGAVSGPIKTALEPIEQQEFENCEQYLSEQTANVGGLFFTIQTSTLPIVALGLTLNVVEQLETPVNENNDDNAVDLGASVAFSHTLDDPSNNIAEATTNGFLAPIIAVCGLATTNTLDEDTEDCIPNFLSEVAVDPETGDITRVFAGSLNAHFNACPSDETIADCIDSIDYTFVDGSLFAPLDFEDNDDTSFCELFTGIIDCSSAPKIVYLGVLQGFLTELNTTDSSGAAAVLGAYLLSGQFGFVDPTATAAQAEVITPDFDNTLPERFDEDYEPCNSLQVAFSGNLPGVTDDGTCTYLTYLAGATEVLRQDESTAELAPTMELVTSLYTLCSLQSNTTDACPEIFSVATFLSLYGVDSPEELLPACEDDDEDKEKIEQAQATLITSIVFYSLTLVGASLGLGLGKAAPFGIAGVCSIIAGALTIASLLIVRSAPVYEEVGVEPTEGELEDFYEEALIPLLALIGSIVMFVAAITYFAAVFVELSTPSDVEGGEFQVKGKEEAEFKKASPPPSAPGATDVVPGTGGVTI